MLTGTCIRPAWACLFRWGSVEKEFSGAEPNTTNNRMELQAVIAGLAALKEQCAVKVVTDSQYVQRAMTQHLALWADSAWRNYTDWRSASACRFPEWAEWFRSELERRRLIESLLGLNCNPIAVKA